MTAFVSLILFLHLLNCLYLDLQVFSFLFLLSSHVILLGGKGRKSKQLGGCLAAD